MGCRDAGPLRMPSEGRPYNARISGGPSQMMLRVDFRDSGQAGGLDPVEAEQGQERTEEFQPGAAFAQEHNAETGSGDGQNVGEGGELGGFKITKKPEVKEIGKGRAEETGVNDSAPGLPGNG